MIIANDCDALECTMCGVKFAVQTNVLALRRGDGRQFWCPNGHVLTYTPPPTPLDRAKKAEAELAAMTTRVDSLTAWVKRAPHLATCNVRVDRPCDCGREALVGDVAAPAVTVGN